MRIGDLGGRADIPCLIIVVLITLPGAGVGVVSLERPFACCDILTGVRSYSAEGDMTS